MWIAAVLFALALVVVYITACVVAFRLFRKRKTVHASLIDRAILILAGIGALCFVYGRFIEPNRLVTKHVEIQSAKIPRNKRPIRIAHFSDLHVEEFPRLESTLVQAVSSAHPDLIVFTGDTLNVAEGLPLARQTISALAKVAPTYVVRGNWDVDNWFRLDLFGGTGAHELNGDTLKVDVAGTPVWIAGLAFDNARALKNTIRSIPSDQFSILLYHSPDLMPDAAEAHVDLYCAGHTHGGQVAMPLYGALVTLSKFGKRYERGLYHEKDTTLYVNRGVGMAGGYLPRVRFWSSPELTLIDVSSVDK
jgi:predicted MPP superfamily phosphohydrolase